LRRISGHAGMKRVLVSGGTGFVGANLVRRLVGDGHAVSLLTHATCRPWRLDALGGAAVARLPVDLADLDAVASVVRDQRPHWVFHLAAYGNSAWQRDLATMLAVNVTATEHL